MFHIISLISIVMADLFENFSIDDAMNHDRGGCYLLHAGNCGHMVDYSVVDNSAVNDYHYVGCNCSDYLADNYFGSNYFRNYRRDYVDWISMVQ